MDGKIGFVSKELPSQRNGDGVDLYWFNEIEGLYAFLLTGSLDKVYLDQSILTDNQSCVLKYQKLLEAMHPQLKFKATRTPPLSASKKGLCHFFPSLKTLFKNGELKTVFQPIVRADAQGQHTIIGFECLSRVQFNNHQFAPDYLFNYAQEKQELTNYDRICLLQSLALAPRLKGIDIYVNVRPQTLISTDFYPWFKEQLKKKNLDPRCIVMEITEQTCALSEREIQVQCELLRAHNIRIALDDFGCGVSNHSLLEITKPHILKISGRFIKNVQNNPTQQKIIRNIYHLAQQFSLDAIVENVETLEEWQSLCALGLTLAQGFYFYHPKNHDDLIKAVAGR